MSHDAGAGLIALIRQRIVEAEADAYREIVEKAPELSPFEEAELRQSKQRNISRQYFLLERVNEDRRAIARP